MARYVIRATAAAATLMFVCRPAAAVWLQCQATGGSDRGPIAFFTTIVDVGTAAPARLAQFQQILSAYAGNYNSTLTSVRTQCFVSDDQQVAASHYSRALDAGYRRLGWDHIVIVQPSDWLPPGDIVNDPSLP